MTKSPRVTLCMLLAAATLALGFAMASRAHAAQESPVLQAKRWSTTALGLSMRPPKGTQVVEQTADQSLVRFTGEEMTVGLFLRAGGTVMGWSPKQTARRGRKGQRIWEQRQQQADVPVELTRAFLRERGKRQLSFMYPSSQQLADPSPNFTVSGHKATRLYMLVRKGEGQSWIFGQAYVILTPKRVAVFQLECSKENWQQHKRKFEAMLKSVKITDPDKLVKKRSQLLKAGQRWLKSLSPNTVGQTLPKSQWYRITRGDKDIGYMRLQARQVTQDGKKGVRLRLQKRVISGERAYDTSGEFFASFDRAMETWDLKTTLRPKRVAKQDAGRRVPAAGQAKQDKQQYPTWVETGVRGPKRTIVTRIRPTRLFQNESANAGDRPRRVRRPRRRQSNQQQLSVDMARTTTGRSHEKKSWPSPNKAYLTQVAQRLYFGLKPPEQSKQMLLYSYSTAAGEITLSRLHMQPLDGDRFAVRFKPSADQGERVSIYDSTGKLIKRRMPTGNVITPTSPKKLKKIWDL